jgi:hypothetical protein
VELLTDLTAQAILTRRQTEGGARYSFHDLLHEYVLEQLRGSGLRKAHELLQSGYLKRGSGLWLSIVNDADADDYLLHNLSFHLIAADKQKPV